MADGSSAGGASSSRDASDIPEERLNINIKTLDSQVFTFCVDKKKPVSLLKEEIASAVGVPSGQQRLIFKGKVLKHDHLLSDYNIEDGDTLHLVARQPIQAQTVSSSEETRSTGTRGNETTGTIPRARIGHSVVLGLNFGDQGENTAVDLSRIIGNVLNSFGVGTTINTLAAGNPSSTSSTSQSVAAGAQNSNGNSHGVNQSSQIPTLLRNMVIPDSLTTLLAFMGRMEQVLSLHSGYQLPTPSDAHGNTQSVMSPSLSQYPSPDALITVLERAQRLLSGPAATALSHLSEHLERERRSTEMAVRGQVQAEAMHVGVALQHLGSLLLELGRSVSTLRMGETPAETMVNAGPAVYISASGPNPLMVQPVTQQTSSLFAIPFPPIVNVGVPEVGLGDASRNISIHVNAGGNSDTAGVPLGSRANIGYGSHGELPNQGTIQNSSGDGRSSLVAGDEPQSDGHNTVAPLPTTSGSSQMESEMSTLAALSQCAQREGVSHLNSQSTAAGQTLENAGKSSGDSDSLLLCSSDISMPGVSEPKSLPGSSESCGNDHAGKSSVKGAVPIPSCYSGSLEKDTDKLMGSYRNKGSNEPVPLGLGLGGLKSKKLKKQSSSQRKNAESQSSGAENQQLIAKGQEILQSLVSQSSKSMPDANRTSCPSGSSFASSPGSRTSQLVQGESQNHGGMLSGMFQQTMRALGVDPSNIPTSTSSASGRRHPTVGNNLLNGGNHQIDLQLVADGVEHEDSPRNIFRNFLEAAGRLHGGNSDLSETLGNDDELINDFMEMMRRQLNRRLQSGTRHAEDA